MVSREILPLTVPLPYSSVNDSLNDEGLTALHLAASEGHEAVIETLLRAAMPRLGEAY